MTCAEKIMIDLRPVPWQMSLAQSARCASGTSASIALAKVASELRHGSLRLPHLHVGFVHAPAAVADAHRLVHGQADAQVPHRGEQQQPMDGGALGAARAEHTASRHSSDCTSCSCRLRDTDCACLSTMYAATHAADA